MHYCTLLYSREGVNISQVLTHHYRGLKSITNELYETYTGIMPYCTVLSIVEIVYWRTVVRTTVYRYSNFVTTMSENVRILT